MQSLDVGKYGRFIYSNHCVLKNRVSNLKESVKRKVTGRVPETIVKCQTSTTLRKLKKKVTHSRPIFSCAWIDVGQGRTSGGDLLKGYQLLPMEPKFESSTVPLIYPVPV